MFRFRHACASLLLALTAMTPTVSAAHFSSPELSIILPRGAQRGTEVTFRFSGARLEDAQEIFFYDSGFEVVEIKPADANNIDVKVNVAADCRLGEHVAQVRTASGISEYRTFYIGALPPFPETEPNTVFEEAQPIELNVTIEGVSENEDVDYFAFNAEKGQRISVEVEGMRFGQTLFDPYIAILDEKRFELTAVDDSPLVRQDAVTSVVIPETGRYIVEMRDSGYGGNGNCRYRLHVGTFPRPTAVYPAGGKAGEQVEVTFLGDAAGPFKQTITVPTEPSEEFTIFASDDRGITPSGHVFRIFEHGNAFEAEPNDSIAEATPAELPLAFNGILETEGDVDFFKFNATAGQVFEVECFGRRIRSAIDPVMNIYKPDNGGLAGNDDSRGPDSYFRFTAPEDGEYKLRITDHLDRGGPEFVYRVEFHPVKPTLTVEIPRTARYSQYRQQVYVPRGNRFATLISASRVNFGGELILEDLDLPAGISVIAPPMPANMTLMPVVFEAAADAPLSGKLVDFKMRNADEATGIRGGFTNRADFVIAAPGQSLYSWRDVDRLPMAVIDELPFHLEIVQPNVPIVRDGSMELVVRAIKKEGWDEQINVQFPFRPPGIGASSSVNIEKGQTEVRYPLSANGNAAIGKWPVYALGSANVNGNAWVSSQMATLEIAEPYIGLALQRGAVELGQETEMVADVTVLKEIQGPATAELLGLPHKVTAEPLQIMPDTKQLVFKVTTAPDSPAGNHKNIFCRITVTESSEPIVHARVGGSELRIDMPLPKPVEAPMPVAVAEAAPPPAAPMPPPEKRLTRLEKLRLEAAQRSGGGGGEE